MTFSRKKILADRLRVKEQWASKGVKKNIQSTKKNISAKNTAKQKVNELHAKNVSASSQSLRFILSLRLYSSFITSRLGLPF